MNSYAGNWVGELRGTNVGKFTFSLEQVAGELRGELILHDAVFGIASFDAVGIASAEAATFRLTPKDSIPGAVIAPAKVTAVLQYDGSLAGTWKTDTGTNGTFLAQRRSEARMPSPVTSPARLREKEPSIGGHVKYRWVPTFGDFDVSEGLIVFKGKKLPAEAPATPSGQEFMASVGVILCDRVMVNGTLRATVSFDEITPLSVCELIVGFDVATQSQVTAGLGGNFAMFSIRTWPPTKDARASWINHALMGDRANLKPNTPYDVVVRVEGSTITLAVNGVAVASATIATTTQARQVGIFAVSQSKVEIAGFEADVHKPKAFVVMQFSSPYNEVYLHVIKDLCKELDIETIRADEIYGPGMIIRDVIDRIAASQLVIADISPDNPNVYFEVGYALALNKPIILLAQRRPPSTPLPFDLSAFRVLFYDDSIGGKPKLEEGLRSHLREILGKT